MATFGICCRVCENGNTGHTMQYAYMIPLTNNLSLSLAGV